ncbi:hypothetical protein ACHAQA_010012 [Verticillium albo-atrum]
MSFVSGVLDKAAIAAIRFGSPAPHPHPDDRIDIPSRDAGRTIRAHVYQSKATSPSPVLVNFHGSGFIIPWHGSDDEFARYVATKSDFTVIDASYRLAPEHPYPAATNDAEDVLAWVSSQPEKFDVSRISVSGFSAGGNLALGASIGQYSIRHVIAVYPPTDLSADPKAKYAPDSSGKVIPGWMARIFNDAYMPPGVDRKTPLVSPSFAPGAEFPDNVLIVTGACDSLAMEAEALAKKIEAVPGKHVVCERMEGCNHAWDKNYKPGSIQETAKNKAYDLVVEMLRR